MPRQQEENFTANDSPSLQFLPRGEEAAGWKLEEDPGVIPAGRLKSYADDRTSSFERYEVIDATIGKYTSTISPTGFATVEIYRFPDFVKAFGAYSTKKTGPVHFLDIPNESFSGAHSVHLWRGPFYVRIVGIAPEANASLVQLAKSVVEKMPAAPGKPAVLAFLPVNNRVANSERFNARSGFGQSFLGNSFQATFNVEGDVMEGLAIPAANRQAAARILDSYRNLYVHNGKLLDPIPNLGEDNFTAEDRYLGRAIAFRIDRFVVAFNGFKDRQRLIDLAIATDQRILGSIRKQLVTEDERQEARRNEPSDGNAQPH